ncbi:hypothetical protein [Sandaracinus amylolyticus]|uniref:Uncharacterized protein n=1 Tax=Sandaracinus amylolyticus TaxID=927083 RepID=A0A0F6VZT2_9BACT|nr:hypothetical protein [Sandaracinus amylolyticus]AKF03615.1 hypothetical protein DB32_000764 [Sandaracinus amylolyticus]
MDLSVVFQRDGALDMRRGFDVGAGPSAGIDVILGALDDLARDGELDPEPLRTASWLAQWEEIVLGEGERRGWSREGVDPVVALCERAELARILSAMEALRPAVVETMSAHVSSWDALSSFLRACHAEGSIALWCDLAG